MSTNISPPTIPADSVTIKSIKEGRQWRRIVAVLLILTAALAIGYSAISIYMATNLVHSSQSLPKSTPLLMAAAQEPAIRAIVADSAYADILPSLELKIPETGHLPPFFTPGGFVAARVIYGIDYTNIRPVDSIARIAPRPIFLIQGSKDSWISPSQLNMLADAARTAPNAKVQTWLVPGADHAQSFHIAREVYVERSVAFYTAALGPDTSVSK